MAESELPPPGVVIVEDRNIGPFAETAGTLIWFSWTVPMVAYDWLRAIRAHAA